MRDYYNREWDKDYNDRNRSFARSSQRGVPSPVNVRNGREYRGPFDERDRSWWDKAGDEVLSWFGDDYAERRRRHDARHRGKGPKNYIRSDERISEDINDRLTDEWNIDASDIEVAVASGDVILTGYVGDRWQKRRAEDVAEWVSGVKNVENRIKVDAHAPKDSVT